MILPHTEVMIEAGSEGAVKAVFGSGPRDEIANFREEITIRIDADRSLVYAHA